MCDNCLDSSQRVESKLRIQYSDFSPRFKPWNPCLLFFQCMIATHLVTDRFNRVTWSNANTDYRVHLTSFVFVLFIGTKEDFSCRTRQQRWTLDTAPVIVHGVTRKEKTEIVTRALYASGQSLDLRNSREMSWLQVKPCNRCWSYFRVQTAYESWCDSCQPDFMEQKQLDTIENRTLEWIEAYKGGLDAKNAQVQVKAFSSRVYTESAGQDSGVMSTILGSHEYIFFLFV